MNAHIKQIIERHISAAEELSGITPEDRQRSEYKEHRAEMEKIFTDVATDVLTETAELIANAPGSYKAGRLMPFSSLMGVYPSVRDYILHLR